MEESSKFIQITATRRADGSPVLYALDAAGGVWWLSPDEQEWRRVTDNRTAGPPADIRVEGSRLPPKKPR